MKVITKKAIESAQACARSLLSQQIALDETSNAFSHLCYDESFGGRLVLIPTHVKRSDSVLVLDGRLQHSCQAVVVWTEIDDPTELEIP